MPLYCVCVDRYDLVQSVQRNVSGCIISMHCLTVLRVNHSPDVVIAIAEELPKNIDRHNPQTTVGFYL